MRIFRIFFYIFFVSYVFLLHKILAQNVLEGIDDRTQDWIFGEASAPKWVTALTKGSHSTLEDTKFILNIPLSESSVTYEAIVDSNATLKRENNQLIITPEEDFHGYIFVDLKLNLSFILKVIPVNDKPMLAEIEHQSIEEDSELYLNLFAMDMDGDDLTYGATIDGNGTVEAEGDMLTIIPNQNYNGLIYVAVAVSDGKDTEESEFNIQVMPINDPPVLDSIDSRSIEEDSSLQLLLSAIDVDGDPLFYSADAGKNAEVKIEGRQLFVTPKNNFNGIIDVLVKVTDNFSSDSLNFFLKVTPIKDAPKLAGIGPKSIEEDSSLRLLLSATDVDGDSLIYSAEAGENADIIIDGRQLLVTPKNNFNGEIDVLVYVDDGTSKEKINFLLKVTPINDAPVLTSIIPDEKQDKINIQMIATDIDGDSLFYSASTGASAKVTMKNNLLTVKPNKDYEGTASLTLKAFDGASSVDTNITLINPLPGVLAIAPQFMEEDSELILKLTAKDIEGDRYMFKSKVNKNTNTEIFNDRLIIKPVKDYFGYLKISLTVLDSKDSTNFDFGINVSPVKDSPVAIAGDDLKISDGCNTNFTLDGTKSWDADNDELIFKWELLNQVNPVVFDTSIVNYTFSDSFTDRELIFVLTVTDITGLNDNDTIVINIINDMPPIVDAGTDFIAPIDEKVFLDGSGSSDKDSKISYSWSVLNNDIFLDISESKKESPHFLYPRNLKQDKIFTFILSANDNQLYCEDKDTVLVTCKKNVGVASDVKYELMRASNKDNKVYIDLEITNQQNWPFDFAAFTLISVKNEENKLGQIDPYRGKNTVKYGIENEEKVGVELVYNFDSPPKEVNIVCKSTMALSADTVFFKQSF